MSLRGPSLQILMQTEMALVHHIILSDVNRLPVPMPDLCSILLNSYSGIKVRMKNSFTSVEQSNDDQGCKTYFILNLMEFQVSTV